MDVVSFSLLLIVVLVILQGVLWAWIGIRARQIFPWWPILREEEPDHYDNEGRYVDQKAQQQS